MAKNVPKALRTPIVRDEQRAGLLLPPEEAEAINRRNKEVADQRVAEELQGKLPMLAAHLGVDNTKPGWEVSLCIILAAERFPGFRVVPKAIGRPQEWTTERYLRLMCAVENVIREHRAKRSGPVTATQALLVLVRRGGEYSPPDNQTEAAWLKTLKNRLAEATHSERNYIFNLLLKDKNNALREKLFDELIPKYCSPRKG